MIIYVAIILFLMLKKPSLNFFKIVTYPPFCINIDRFCRKRFDLLAEPPDMDVHRADVARIIISPDDVEQAFSAVNAAWVVDE